MDFSETEIKDITDKFNEVGFSCQYRSFNLLKVDPHFANYHLTIHKRNDNYYFFVYRPNYGSMMGLFTNSYNCQKLVCQENIYPTIEELIERIKDIEWIMIDNSIVCKDIFTDIINSHIRQILYLYDRDSELVNQFNENLHNILVEIAELFNKIIMKATDNKEEKLAIQSHPDIKELCNMTTAPFQLGYSYMDQTTTEEYIEDFKTICQKLRTLNSEIFNKVKRVFDLKNQFSTLKI